MDEYPVIDLSHLLPAAQGLARLPADERIQRIRADRWIGYPRAVEALKRADVVVHDGLIDARVLDLAPASAQRISVAKRRSRHTLPQAVCAKK